MTKEQAKAEQQQLWEARDAALKSYRPVDPNGDRFMARARELCRRFERRAEIVEAHETRERLELHLSHVREHQADLLSQVADEAKLDDLGPPIESPA